MPFDSTRETALITLLDADGNPVPGVSQSHTELEAASKASQLPPGTYYLQPPRVRLDFTVDECEVPGEPDDPVDPNPDPEPDPEPDPDPIDPEPPVTDGDRYRIADNGTGPNRSMWSIPLGLRWDNHMGDWTDANGDKQGNDPFAEMAVTRQGQWVSADVTELAKLEAVQSKGMLLLTNDKGGSPTFASRNYPEAQYRPVLVVNGEEMKPLAFARFDSSTNNALDSRKAIKIASNSRGIIQFPLQGVDVQSAELRLYVTHKWSGTANIEVYRADPPTYNLGEGTVEDGLAAEVGEENLAGHGSVLRYGDFSKIDGFIDGMKKGTPHEIVDGPFPGMKAFRGKFIPRTPNSDNRLSMWAKINTMPADLTDPARPPATVTEGMYIRQYVLLEDDFTSPIDANKGGIGIDLRLGYWVDVEDDEQGGYWQSVGGNGGLPGTGLVVDRQDGLMELQGHSIRMEFGKSFPGSPYPDLRPVQSYVYHLDQSGYYGDMVRLGNSAIERGYWFCIEQYIRMNSIEGPYDALGNGQAVKDGQLITWLNGVRVHERKNFRWRRHPKMGIEGPWFNWYFGGKSASDRVMHYQVTGVAVSNQYIGLHPDHNKLLAAA